MRKQFPLEFCSSDILFINFNDNSSIVASELDNVKK